MKLHRAFLGAAFAISLPAVAFAADGLYVGAGAGLNVVRDASTSFQGGTAAGVSRTMDLDAGFTGVLTTGYKFSSGIRTELEAGFRRNTVKSLDGTAADGSLRSLSLMGNVLYDFNTGTPWMPYVGAGIGTAKLSAKTIRGGTAAGSPIAGTTIDGTTTKLAYQGIVGVAYNVNDNLALTADYRYFATSKPSFSAIPAATTTGVKSAYGSHNILAGLRYTFTPPAPAPAPVPEPVMVQVQNEYLVFFDHNSTKITKEGAKTIADAVATSKATSTIRLDVVGHADTSGQPTYNMRLSQKRAEAVKAELVRRGIAAKRIVVAWKGESQPLVATADGVREPSNRRASVGLVIQ